MQSGSYVDSVNSKLNVKHIYLRFFDVDWNPYQNEALPVASLNNNNFNNQNNLNSITASVFITNNVLLKSDYKQLDTLAIRLVKKVNFKIASLIENGIKNDIWELNNKHNWPSNEEFDKMFSKDSLDQALNTKYGNFFKELLIDCDWTDKTKERYFYLLTKIKNQFKLYPRLKENTLAATIRLWQYKHFGKAGVPPVDRGLLMCYNVNPLGESPNINSIGSYKDIKEFITHDDYPLKLDIALPIFSWAVIYRGNKYIGLINDYEVLSNKSLFQKVSENEYKLLDDYSVGQTFLREGDLIVIEKISHADNLEVIKLLKNYIEFDKSSKITLFSFDNKYINNYGIENISDLYTNF
jgi:hypothetical protein